MSHGQIEPDKYLSDSYSGASYIDKEIVKNVLHFLQSENKNSAIYKYKVPTDCLNVNPLTIIILVKPMDLLLIYSITNKVR